MTLPIIQRSDGTVACEVEVRRILREAMKGSGKQRHEIAREMAEVLGRTLTASILADFSRNATKKRQVRFPAAWVPALCEVTGDDSLQRYLMGERLKQRCKVGEDVLNSRDMWEALAPVLAKRWVRNLRQKSKTSKASRRKRARG